MKQHDVSLLSFLKELEKLVEFHFFGSRIIVRIILEVKSTSLDNTLVVCPSRSWYQYCCRDLLLDEFKSDPESSSS